MKYPLQNISFSGFADSSLYYSVRRGAVKCCSEGLELKADSEASFGTFANIIDLNFWRQKSTAINFSVRIVGLGLFTLKAFVIQDGSVFEVSSWQLGASQRLTETVLDLEDALPEEGGLFFVVRSHTRLRLSSICFGTELEPLKKIKLGLVITHYKREMNVFSFVKNIINKINDFNLQSKLRIVVVDNSNTLNLETNKLLDVIQNRNLGGAGGFSRGMLHLKNNEFTHALFMDDDALSDFAVIHKTMSILEYSRIENLSIAGTLLDHCNTTKIIESGGLWSGGPKSINADLNIADFNSLKNFFSSNRCPDYGAWWYYAFPLKLVSHYPYPFFVRGDDQLFGFQNKFDNYSPPGIYAFGERFTLKENAFTKYLSTRSIFVLHMYKNSSFYGVIKFLVKSHLSCLLTCNYKSAGAVTLAIKHILLGGDFFARNENPLNDKDLRVFLDGEHIDFMPNLVETCDLAKNNLRSIKKFFFIATFAGLLLPEFMFREVSCIDKESQYRDPFSAFPSKYIVFVGKNKKIEVSRYSKWKLISGMLVFLYSLLKLMIGYNSIKESYLNSVQDLTSEEYWNRFFFATKSTEIEE